MRVVLALVLAMGLSTCASPEQQPELQLQPEPQPQPEPESAAQRVGWSWLIQYSYWQPSEDVFPMDILVQMDDSGRVEYFWNRCLGANNQPHREVWKSPGKVEAVKREIEQILAGLDDSAEYPASAFQEFHASIVVRTAEELVDAWGDDRYGDPIEQTRKVFRNLRSLPDEAHLRIQAAMQEFNAEAEELPWSF